MFDWSQVMTAQMAMLQMYRTVIMFNVRALDTNRNKMYHLKQYYLLTVDDL